MLIRDVARRVGPLAGAGTSQVLSSLSNVVVVIAVGRGSGAAGLGRYTLAFGAYLVVLAFSRALVSEPLLTLRRELGAGDAALKAAATATGWLGAVGGAVCILVGMGLRRAEFIAVGLLMVPLYVQDLLRFAFFQTGRQWRAALLDAVWVLASLASFPIIVSWRSPVMAAGLWGAGAMIAAVPGLLILRVRLVGPVTAYRWWRLEARHLGVGLVFESIALTVGSQASLWVIAVVLGDGDLGLLKAAQTVLAPVMMAVNGFTMLAIPQMAQSPRGPSTRWALRISGRALVLVGAVAAALVWMGPPVARLLFGSDLSLERALLLAVGAHFAANALAIGPASALKVQQRGGTLAVVRAITAATGVIAVAAACAPLGIVGAAWALALGALLFALGTAVAVPTILRGSQGRRLLEDEPRLSRTAQAVARLDMPPLPVHPPDVERWRPLVRKYWTPATGEPVDYCLLVMWAESRGAADAVNPASTASGLYQHPASSWPHRLARARGWWAGHGFTLPPGDSVFDPELNIAVGAWLWTVRGWQAWPTTQQWQRQRWTPQVRWLGDRYGTIRK